MEVARARLAEELDANGDRLAEEPGADGDRLAEELDPARCWHSNCSPRPRRLVAGALVLVKDRDAATGSKRALLKRALLTALRQLPGGGG